jgi:CMP-N,N'-diacetyllegionaminic acid synthase
MPHKQPTAIALIPARSGSTRVRDKNIRALGAHPLIAYSIAAALDSGVFDAVVVSTDSESYAEIARYYGADVPFMRPAEIAGETSPDIQWVEYTLRRLAAEGTSYDCFSILRPTSPFRLPETIRRAWDAFKAETGIDSLRAVEPVKQHPGKMWVVRGNRMSPLLPLSPGGPPWHSRQYQDLPLVHVQNASLEIAHTRLPINDGTIAGEVVMPFLTEGFEGADVNTERDWAYLEDLLESGKARLPRVEKTPFPGQG